MAVRARKYDVVVVCTLICSLMAGCAQPTGDLAVPDSLHVTVSILPQIEIVSRVSGDAATVSSILRPGDSPTSFDLTPRKLAQVTTSDVVFTIGVPADRLMESKLAEIAPDLRVVNMASGVEKRRLETGSGVEDAHHHHHGTLDPHVWLDPIRVVTMAEKTRDTLCGVAPDRCLDFTANLLEYETDLRAADERIAAILKPFEGRAVCVFHPAYGYFLERYGLRQVSVEVEGKEPTPRRLSDLIRRLQAGGTRAIFVQPQFSDRSARTIAETLGARVIPLDPLASDHLVNLERMAQHIAASLTDPPD